MGAVTPPTTPTDPGSHLLARRPVMARDGRVVGHQLDFGDEAGPSERATARALLHLGGDRRLIELTGGVPAWIGVSRDLLLTVDPFPLAHERLVLRLEPDPQVDEELLSRLMGLRAEGHAIALRDFLPRDELEPLLPLVNFVEVDLAAYGPKGIAAVLERLPRQRPRVVATNVASPAQRDVCLEGGADLLQGFFFEVPRRPVERPVPVASLARIRTLVALRGTPTFEDVERVVGEDPGLTLRLLRFANSAAAGGRRRFSTVREALVLLGSDRVRQFLLLVLLSELGEGRPALVSAALLRARLCESIARDLALADPATAFTAGILSVVDALLDQPMREVLRDLPVTDELRWALMARSGSVGAVLDMAVRVERCRPRAEVPNAGRLDEAVGWTDQALSGLA
jgi:c-di-GMP phosphodiesterase